MLRLLDSLSTGTVDFEQECGDRKLVDASATPGPSSPARSNARAVGFALRT